MREMKRQERKGLLGGGGRESPRKEKGSEKGGKGTMRTEKEGEKEEKGRKGER